MKDLTNITVVTTNEEYSELYCSNCAEQFREIDGVELAPRYTWENNESDTPSHCPECGVLLEQDMTSHGLEYVRENVESALTDGNTIALDPDSIVAEWHTAYGKEVKEAAGIDLDSILDVETVTRHYLIAQLWTGTVDYMTATHEFGEEALETGPLDAVVQDIADLPEDVRTSAEKDVTAFLELIGEWLYYFPNAVALTAEQLGHDFSLTRNNHGAGFWDRGNGELGQWLTRAAQSFGNAGLYGSVVLDPAGHCKDCAEFEWDLESVLPETLAVWESN